MKEYPLQQEIHIFPVTGIKEHLVSQYIFPVNETIFTVTGNEYPVIGLGETHQSLINLL